MRVLLLLEDGHYRNILSTEMKKIEPRTASPDYCQYRTYQQPKKIQESVRERSVAVKGRTIEPRLSAEVQRVEPRAVASDYNQFCRDKLWQYERGLLSHYGRM